LEFDVTAKKLYDLAVKYVPISVYHRFTFLTNPQDKIWYLLFEDGEINFLEELNGNPCFVIWIYEKERRFINVSLDELKEYKFIK